MQLTKGAIGNLINRYRAVLKKCHLLNVFGSLAVAGMLVMGGAAAAGAATATAKILINGTDYTDTADINCTGAVDFGVYTNAATGTFTGKKLNVSTTPGELGGGNVGLWATSTSPESARSVINFGQTGTTESIDIEVTDNSSMEEISIGVWSSGGQEEVGGEINLSAETVTIKGHSNSGWIYGIYAQNTTTTTEYDQAVIDINAGKTYIDVTSGQPGRADAIVAMSQGIINIESDLYVNTQGGNGYAIVTRGDSTIAINTSGTHIVQMNGDINFNYDKKTSGTRVDADVDITLNGADSYWNGNTLISWDEKPDDSKLTVSEMTLTVKDGATWTPTAIEETADQKYTPLNNLILDDGNIDVNKGVEIAIDKVSGTGYLANEGTVTLTSGALEGRTENAGIINLDPDASISNVTFVKGDGVAGQNVPGKGFISVDAEGAHLYGGMDFGNAVEASVSSVAVSDNTTTITGASISKADVTRDDGATSGNNKISSGITATLADGKSLAIVGSNFADNKVTLKGIDNGGFPDGALLRVDSIGTSGNLTISNTEFTGNTYTVQTPGALWNGTYGGIVAVGDNQGAVVMDNVTISGNTVTDLKTVQGAGYWQYGGSIEATGLTVSGNTASVEKVDDVTINGEPYSAGGAMALVKVEGSIKDSDFSNNTNKHFNISSGGALFVAEDSNITLENDVFNENTATGKTAQGGAIYNEGTLTVEGGSFTDNSAAPADGSTVTVSNVGGAIYNADDAKLSINGTRFEGNTAAIAGAVNNQYDSSHITGITNAFFVNNTASLSAGGALRNQGTIDSISGTTFEGNTAGNGGALWNGAGGTITNITDTTFTGNKSTNDAVGGGAITNAGDIEKINATTFTDNSAAGNGGAINNVKGGKASITLSDTTFTGNTADGNGGALYNGGNLTFSGNNTFSGNTAAGQANDIYNAGSITVADGTTTLGSGLTQVNGKVTVSTGATLDMASGSSLSFEGDNTALTIDGGTFVADFGQLLTDYATTNTDNGIKDSSIIGQSGNLNLRLDGVDYTLDEYNAAKNALLGQDDVTENATLNFLNANLKLDEGQNLVVGATVADNEVTIEMAPVVADAAESPIEAADDGTITSVPNQIVSVVAADDSAKELLPADTITVSGSEFIAKGLQIASTASPEAEAVTLAVTDGSNVTLTGGEAGFTGVVNAENEAVATNVEVSNASLTVGLEGNDSAQNLTLNDVKVADGTFEVAGNGLDTTQVEASTLSTGESGTVAVNNASLTVEKTVVDGGLLSITNTVADLGMVKAIGGVISFDPSYGRLSFDGNVGSTLPVGDGSVVNVASGLDNLQELAQKAGFTTLDQGNGEFFLGTGESMLAVGQTITLDDLTPSMGGKGTIIVDAGVDVTGTMVDGDPVTAAAYFGNNSLLVVNGNTINGDTAAIKITEARSGQLNVQNGAKLLIADAVAGQTYTVISGATNTDATTGTAFNGTSYTDASASGWKGSNLLTSSDMVTLTSEDGTVFKSVSADAHTVFPNLSHELATAVNTLYGQQLNDVDADAMGVRFLSRATDNRYLGADKQAAASTIESAARMAFAGAVPQMTKMASDAGTNAVVNRLGFANPADGAQAMNAEGKIVDRNTTGFALWIAPLWQNQHGWGMEAGNLDYGFNGNLGGVSLGADYTFENAIRAGITFNIGGGYAESSGGDLNSTENRMTFWGLGAYAGWNYENFGLMADVSYTSTWNDLEQDMDGRMGMGDLEADVQATAISAGLRAEYKLETSVLDIIPHIGVRYMSLNTWGYDVDTNGGTVLEGDGFHQDIWTFPIGVTFSKDFTLDSGWFFKPSVDFSVIPAAGDIKAKQDVAFTGLPGTYEVETQMMDYLTWQGGVGIQMGNDNLSFGVNYTLQAGQNTTGHGVFGSFRYEF